jgi:uncharacterized protein (TIGR00255 family)
MLHQSLFRGKIELVIQVENFSAESSYTINHELAKRYFRDLRRLADEIDEENQQPYLPLLMKMPEVMLAEKVALKETEWITIQKAIQTSVEELLQFRKAEGSRLLPAFEKNIAVIRELLSQIDPHEKDRIEQLKSRLIKNLTDLQQEVQFDKNRFEQELVYYLEKLDITEEKVRLANHCDYFLSTLKEEESMGKRLNFIAQEMGREINTIGSKANHTAVQHYVVGMKDELEKIKEQLYNIL